VGKKVNIIHFMPHSSLLPTHFFPASPSSVKRPAPPKAGLLKKEKRKKEIRFGLFVSFLG